MGRIVRYNGVVARYNGKVLETIALDNGVKYEFLFNDSSINDTSGNNIAVNYDANYENYVFQDCSLGGKSLKIPNGTIGISPIYTFSTPFTTSTWIKINGDGEVAPVMRVYNANYGNYSSMHQYTIDQNNLNLIKFQVRYMGSWKDTINTSFALDNWYHIVTTYDLIGTHSMYVNDVLIGTYTGYSIGLSGTQDMNYAYLNATHPEIELKNIRFYTRLLSRNEITALYNQDLGL